MNQSLEKIIDFLQQTWKLSVEEKALLDKAVKDIESEMAITAFKLDQTEKVKHTTAILLEETINELEQKRKEVEAQNRELEIESSLERVRAVAMGMHNPSEMVEVCRIISGQLEFLKVKDIRNVQTAVINEAKGTYVNYEYYSRHDRLLTTEVSYKTHHLQEEFANQMLKGAGEFFQTSLSGQEVRDWYEYQKTTNQFADSFLEEAKTLNYYMFSLGPIALGLSTYSPLIEEEITLFKRFRNVFGLAYRRFLDIQKAEAQAREAQIELSLERVRAGAMAMRQSAELGQLIYVLYQELTKLDAQLDRCFIMIVNPENKGIIWWLAGKEGLLDENGFFIQMNQHPSHLMYLDCWQKRKKKWQYLFEGKEKRDWDHFGFNKTALAKLPEFIKQDMAGVKKIHLSGSSDTFGSLVTGSLEPLEEEHQDIIKRFTIVFNQAYTRFLDLQKAEAQAREAIKQSSLDRVRGQIASMRTTTDLQRITPLIWHELIALGVPFFRCGVFIVNDETVHVQAFLSAPDGRSLAALDLPFDSSELTNNLLKNWRKGLIFKTHWNKEEFISWMQSMVKEGQVPNTETYQDASKPPESLDLHFVPFAQGMLYVGNIQPLTNEELDLLRSLAETFSIAFARYEDFRKLEMAKQSIETALSELKAAQSQLVQSEKMASLGELTAGIAHEIQNPLNFVNNFSEVNSELINEMEEEIEKGNLDEVKALAQDIRENERKINHHGKRADAIVKGMLQHSRSSSGLKEPTDINALADEYLRLAYHGLRARDMSFNATMKTNFDNNIGKINVVPQDIGRVILNLITNAFHAVDSKKNASPSSATGQYEPTVSVATKKIGHTISISVRDNGTGIPEQIRNKIFQPFFTTKPTGEGTGLGLSMSYDIVTKGHGGDIQVETAEGDGSVFTIHLPI